MEWYQILFLVVLFVPAAILIIADKIRDSRQAKIISPYFTGENLDAYEGQLTDYLKSIELENGCTVEDILKKINYRLNYCDRKNLPDGKEAETQKEAKCIKVDESLNQRHKIFIVAHEVGHFMRGFGESACRNRHPVSPDIISQEKYNLIEEEICDYIAAAILLPYEYMIKLIIAKNYALLKRRERIDFIKEIANEKLVSEQTVSRRIAEVLKLKTYRDGKLATN